MTAVVVSSVVLVIVTVAVHLACLRGLLRLLRRLGSLHHARVGVMVLGAVMGHLIEIGLFGVAIGWLERARCSRSLEDPGSTRLSIRSKTR